MPMAGIAVARSPYALPPYTNADPGTGQRLSCAGFPQSAVPLRFSGGPRLEDESFALHRPRELEALLRDHASLHEAERMVETRFSISAVELPRNGRFRVWVRYFHLDQAGAGAAAVRPCAAPARQGQRPADRGSPVTRLPFAQMRAWRSRGAFLPDSGLPAGRAVPCRGRMAACVTLRHVRTALNGGPCADIRSGFTDNGRQAQCTIRSHA